MVVNVSCTYAYHAHSRHVPPVQLAPVSRINIRRYVTRILIPLSVPVEHNNYLRPLTKMKEALAFLLLVAVVALAAPDGGLFGEYVSKVFNDKVVALLKLRGCRHTAKFIQIILNWWNVVNVCAKAQDQPMNDPYRAVQDPLSTNLQTFQTIFQEAASGHGASRIQCLTRDTKKTLVQTTEGLLAVCHYLFRNADFLYVLLHEIQSDRLEGEFSVYR
ncbi:hypothetical protein FHG87_022797 [Trinorchestia longiramus]|nr:hypothetical protein FHG87_022797 [Trinorchestia longiramus]